MTDEEFRQFAIAFGRFLEPYLQAEPDPGRKRRVLSTIVIPD